MGVEAIPISGAQVIEDVLEDTFGLEESDDPRSRSLYDEYGLGWRRLAPDLLNHASPDCKVVVDEHVPMLLTSIEPGMAVFESIAVSIGVIRSSWNVYDVERSRRYHIGESSAEYIEKAEGAKRKAREDRVADIDHEIRADWEKLRKGSRSISMDSPSGDRSPWRNS
jgi:hypothetical protein